MTQLVIPSHIQKIRPYVPGKPIEETRRELRLKHIVKLASNENPLGPSPLAKKAMRNAMKETHRYPDASHYQLKKRLAKLHRTAEEHFLIGNGSEEVIDLLVRGLTQAPNDAILIAQHSFVAYRIAAQTQGIQTIEAPLDEDLRPRLDLMLDHVKKNASIRLIFFPNPNNPTGAWIPKDEFFSFIKEVGVLRSHQTIVVADCAYQEYVDKRVGDPSKWLRDFPHLFVTRTFSKIYGLGGMRIGYGMGQKELIASLMRIKKPFNVSLLGLEGATAALSDTAFVKKTLKVQKEQQRAFRKFFDHLGIPYTDSQGNFLLINAKEGFGVSGQSLFEACLKKGVILRPVGNYGLPDHLRVTIGNRKENARAMEVLEKGQKRLRK